MKATQHMPEEQHTGGSLSCKAADPIRDSTAANRRPDPAAVHSVDALPASLETRSLRQATVRQMQQHHGNAFVQRALGGRVDTDDDPRSLSETTSTAQAPAPTTTTTTQSPASATAQAPTTATTQSPASATAQAPATTTDQAPTGPVEQVAPAGPASGEAPTEITAGGNTVRVTAGGVNVQGSMVTVDAGMTRVSGVLQADTLIANTVVGSAYTPGPGNIQ